MSDFYSFKTSAFGYDKDEVNEVVSQLMDQNSQQKNKSRQFLVC